MSPLTGQVIAGGMTYSVDLKGTTHGHLVPFLIQYNEYGWQDRAFHFMGSSAGYGLDIDLDYLYTCFYS